ncbi:MAG TPA: nuclear transport factor 2 family protein, partial [Chitinophagaceae bacterium]|nr:nuclear transport factor 2 family protein [Chitinophagaceae bacterium]
MKKTVFTLLITVFSLLISSAQSNPQTDVANATEQLRKAMMDGDKTTLEKLTEQKLSYGHSGGHIDDKKEFVEKLVSGKSDFVTIDLSEQTISISGKVAIVRHILHAKTNDNGMAGE